MTNNGTKEECFFQMLTWRNRTKYFLEQIKVEGCHKKERKWRLFWWNKTNLHWPFDIWPMNCCTVVNGQMEMDICTFRSNGGQSCQIEICRMHCGGRQVQLNTLNFMMGLLYVVEYSKSSQYHSKKQQKIGLLFLLGFVMAVVYRHP